ncbi:UNVERIFIED_CONTAM: hypothetical protein Sradi_7091800 [Sesamum radiatum]|uniref:Uncharacterized protein n=1 Tax=Sesamum radiatum TaxID=300843 RepID=A0AAW2J2P2_SESRA
MDHVPGKGRHLKVRDVCGLGRALGNVLGLESPQVVYIPGSTWVRLGAGLALCGSYPLEEVFEEVPWRESSVSGGAGLGGPRTIVPLAGTRDVPGTTCRA